MPTTLPDYMDIALLSELTGTLSDYSELLLGDSELNENIRIALAKNKDVTITVKLLDEEYQEIEEMSGKIKTFDYDLSGESTVRRTSSLTLNIPRKEQMQYNFQNTWINRMVDLSCGVKPHSDSTYHTYNLGRMLMVDGSSSYNATTQEVKLSLMDLMCSLTEERGSQIGKPVMIEAGSNVKNVITNVIEAYGTYKNVNICDFDDVIPYDLVIDSGSYPYEILTTILDLFPYYEMFYDRNGVFTVQRIPTKQTDPVEIPHALFDKILIGEDTTVDFSLVKNTTEIFGRELDEDYYATVCTTSGAQYNLTISESFENLIDGETFGFTPSSTSVSGQMIKIQDNDAYYVYTQAGDGTYTALEAGAIVKDVPCVVRYTDEKFVLEGELQVHVIIQEIVQAPSPEVMVQYKTDSDCRDVSWVVNANSPFACTLNSTTGKIEREKKQVLMGGEYDAIYTTQLAYERARYENWLATRLQDTVTIETILLPWIDINDKIQYTSPVSEEVGTFLVQSVTFDFKNWTMDVKASRFYSYYPWE